MFALSSLNNLCACSSTPLNVFYNTLLDQVTCIVRFILRDSTCLAASAQFLTSIPALNLLYSTSLWWYFFDPLLKPLQILRTHSHYHNIVICFLCLRSARSFWFWLSRKRWNKKRRSFTSQFLSKSSPTTYIPFFSPLFVSNVIILSSKPPS